MSSTYLTNGIVLRRRDHREHDRVLTLYTEKYGKIETVARGVKKITSKLAGHLEPMSYSSFMLARGRTFDVLATSIKLSSFRIPQTDLFAFALASYFFEVVDRLTRPNLPDRALFRLLVEFLETFEKAVEPGSTATTFQRTLIMEYALFHVLRVLGFAPVLEHCVVGNEPLLNETVSLSLRHGGLVCALHKGNEQPLPALSPQSVEILRLMADHEREAIRLMNRQDAALRQIANALRLLVEYQVGEPLQSQAFLATVLQSERSKDEGRSSK